MSKLLFLVQIMPPNSDAIQCRGSRGFQKPLSGVTVSRRDGQVWLDGKRLDDGAEGYWRIHDDLYNMTEFIKTHPGGPEWLEMTEVSLLLEKKQNYFSGV